MSGSSASQPEHTNTTVSSSGRMSRPALLALAAVVVAVVWYGFLVALIVLTEVPVTINRGQIEESSLVVAGTVAADGKVAIRQVFKGTPPGNELQLVEPLAFPEGDWILPLLQVGRRFEVTPTRLPNKAGLVYNLTDDAVTQIEQLLD